jgi:tetratricopeptide (TPR) repeat protein
MRFFAIAGSVLLMGCAGTQVAPPVVDGTQQAGEQDRVRQQAAAPAPQREEPVANTQVTPVQVAKIQAQPIQSEAPQQSSEISPAVLDLLEQADLQASQGNRESAVATLERALRIAPREPEVYYQMARVRLDMGEAREAEQLALKAVDLAPDAIIRRDSWNLVATAREAAGDTAGATAARLNARGG